jgi:hypothetical protein
MKTPFKVDRYGEDGNDGRNGTYGSYLSKRVLPEDRRGFWVRLFCSLRPWGKRGIQGKAEF